MSDATPIRDENNQDASRREQQPLYRQANSETSKHRQHEWRKANPEKVKAAKERYDAEHRETILAQKRIAERRRAERLKKEKQARARAIERAKKYDAAHPEQVRERERRYRQAHRDLIRQRQRDYYARNKEQIKKRNAERFETDPRYQEFHQRYREANREKIHERQRKYRADPEVYERTLEYNRQWRQRERRRLKAGLPRPQLHRTRKPDKGANAAAANLFFTRGRNEDERHRIVAELDQLRDEKERAQKIAQRRHAERLAGARERAARVDDYLSRHGRKLREEVRLDSRARELRGAQPYPDFEAEARRRAAAVVAGPIGRAALRSLPSALPLRAPTRVRPNTGPVIGASAPKGLYGQRCNSDQGGTR